MLRKHGDWMPLGSADEQRPAAEGTVEAWGRTAGNLAAHAPGDDTPKYFILLEWDQGVITSIRDFRYVPYIAQEADLG